MPLIELFVPEYIRPLLESFRFREEKPYVSSLIEEIDEGVVLAETVELPSAENFEGYVSHEGGEDHRYFCNCASLWLDRKGIEWSAGPRDLWCPGGRTDIIAKDRSLTVEVGTTSVLKVLKCLKEGMKVIVAPYFNGHQAFLLTPKVGHEKILGGVEGYEKWLADRRSRSPWVRVLAEKGRFVTDSYGRSFIVDDKE